MESLTELTSRALAEISASADSARLDEARVQLPKLLLAKRRALAV